LSAACGSRHGAHEAAQIWRGEYVRARCSLHRDPQAAKQRSPGDTTAASISHPFLSGILDSRHLHAPRRWCRRRSGRSAVEPCKLDLARVTLPPLRCSQMDSSRWHRVQDERRKAATNPLDRRTPPVNHIGRAN